MEEKKLVVVDKKVIKRIIIGFVVLILLNIYGLIKIRHLQDTLEGMKNDIYSLSNNTNASIGGISGEIERTLKKQGSIISEFNYFEEGLDEEKRAINFTLKGTPKIYTDDLKFNFTYTCNDGQTVTVPGVLDENKNYSAKISVPMSTDVKFGVILDYGDEIKKEICDSTCANVEKYQLQFEPQGFDGSYKSKKDEIIFHGKIENWIYPSSIEGNYVIGPICNIKMNDEVIEELKLEPSSEAPSKYSIDFKKSYKLNQGDRLDIFIEVNDTYGFHYKYCVMTVSNENGEIVVLDYPEGLGVVVVEP